MVHVYHPESEVWTCNPTRDGIIVWERAAQSETVTHLESFPIMKQDMERLCFNGEREKERERERGRWNESSRSLSVPPDASICRHWLCSRAELMPTCCTRMASICTCVFQKAFSFVSTQSDSWNIRILFIQTKTDEDNLVIFGFFFFFFPFYY